MKAVAKTTICLKKSELEENWENPDEEAKNQGFENREVRLMMVGNGAQKDVKNEDRPGYMYENTGDSDKMS